MKRGTALVITAVAGVLAGVLLFVGVVSLTGSGKAKSHLGDDRFVVGRARTLARTVDRVGPLLFQDLAGGEQDIYVQLLDGHWQAFAAHELGAPRRCQLKWRNASRDFIDTCSHEILPPDGGNVRRYQTIVDAKGKLVVDLRAPN